MHTKLVAVVVLAALVGVQKMIVTKDVMDQEAQV